MEPQFRTSFVPKKPVNTTVRKTARRVPLGLLFVLTLVAFLAAIVLAIVIFLYQQYLGNSIARKGQELEAARATFEPALIQELTRLDARLETADTLLNRHTALTRLYAFLENNTLQNVQFRNFRYNMLPDGNIVLSMGGRARSFASVALQSDVFGSSDVIRSPVFENLNVDDTGDVVFDLAAFVDPQFILYRPTSVAEPIAPEEFLEEETAATTSATTTSSADSPEVLENKTL